ncbi:nucleotide pyrophosphohydrolase [Micromonospora sp. DT81.3]|uniref:nucleotide pyrophosphohydrolase n=1 Tax=Micromonospora sp. DT81.3 TaxID=3416523 RepID=UPI003CF266FC
MVNQQTQEAIKAFTVERDWGQFHSTANLAKSISIEAGELLECFQWSDDADPRRVAAELADILTYCVLLADRLGVDLDEIVLDKLRESAAKYPVDTARGKSAKYDAL